MACLPRIVAASDSFPMNNKRRRSPQGRPRVIDRIQLAMSMGRHLDGIWVGSWRDEPAGLTRVEHAMLLVKQHSPLHYARIRRDLEKVWVHLLAHGLGEYKASLKACLLDERYVTDPATTIEQIASTIVHEATHARLERYGIAYTEEQRAKIEAICFRRELAFAARLPDGFQLQQEVARALEWYQANPDYFHDAQFQQRRTGEEVEALQHLGTPDWLIKVILGLQPVIRLTARLFRLRSH